MDRQHDPKRRKSGQPHQAYQTPAIPPRLLHVVLGLVLVTAGAIKLYEFASKTQDESLSALILMTFSEAEVLGGIWLLGGFHTARAHAFAIAVFAGLAIAGLLQIVAGKCSCGCFGTLPVSPWLVLIFDVTAVAALLRFRPADLSASIALDDSILPGVVGLLLLAAIVAVGGRMEAERVSVTGVVKKEGSPLGNASLTLTGATDTIEFSTDGDGKFQLSFVRPGLYAVGMSNQAHVATPYSGPIGPAPRIRSRSRISPAAHTQPSNAPPLLWVEFPVCTTLEKVIEF